MQFVSLSINHAANLLEMCDSVKLYILQSTCHGVEILQIQCVVFVSQLSNFHNL